MRFLTLVLAVGVGLSSQAWGSELSLFLSGSEFEGGPAFEVALGDKVVGSGTVDPLPSPGQATVFTFDVPISDFDGNPAVRVRLTNDKFGGPGQDRNLYIYRVSISGVPLTAKDFSILAKGVPVSRKIRSNHLDIWSSQEVAVAPAPAQGWLAPTAEATKPISIAAPCNVKASITSIAKVSVPLQANQLAKLDPIVHALQSGGCDIVVAGYASEGGNIESNQKASLKRAQLVLEALKAKGANLASVVVKGMGGTSDFGGDDASNQRVEITLSPSR